MTLRHYGQRGAVINKARELVELARRHGYGINELIQIIQGGHLTDPNRDREFVAPNARSGARMQRWLGPTASDVSASCWFPSSWTVSSWSDASSWQPPCVSRRERHEP